MIRTRSISLVPGLLIFSLFGCSDPATKENSKVSRTSPAGEDSRESVTNAATRFALPATVADDYIGSGACRTCHAAVCDEFALHPMGRSMTQNLTPDESSEGGSGFTSTAGLRYEVSATESGTVHHEILKDEHGTPVYDRSEEMDFGIGSGKRGRGFGFLKAGRLYLSPVTWYSRVRKWDLSPGYDPANNPGFERKASDGCMACHAGRMASVPGARDQFGDSIFLEAAIGCERCHGPGGQHSDFHTSNSGEDRIVNPARLNSNLRDAVCFQCHLQGERRVVRYGRTNYDFRPGMNVNDVWVTFLKSGDASGNAVAAVSQVEQMLKSRCYLGSNGAMGCISCHDPHTVPHELARGDFYRAQCLKCHGESGNSDCPLPRDGAERTAANDSCVACHMPPLAASDIPHSAQTDHRLLRDPGSPSATSSNDLMARGSVTQLPPVFDEQQYTIPPHELVRAQIILIAEKSTSSQNQSVALEALELLRGIEPVAADDADLFEAAGLLYETIRKPARAEEYWLRALSVRPEDEAVLELLATMHHTAGNMPKAREYYRRLVEANNSRPTYFGRYAHVLGQTGRMAEGIEAAEKALSLNPALPQAHGWLAEAFQLLGNRERSNYHRRQAEEQFRVRRLKNQAVQQPQSDR